MHTYKLLRKLSVLVLGLLALHACTETIDTSSRYVFKDETVLSYLEKHEAYSEYVKLLHIVPISRVSETTVAQVLSARGNYTCFAPTDSAIHKYLVSLVDKKLIPTPSWDAFPTEDLRDSIRQVIVYNSLIDGEEEAEENYYNLAELSSIVSAGTETTEIDLPNMYGRKMNVRQDAKTGNYFINECPMDSIQCDILTVNGVIHQMKGVIAPNGATATDFFLERLSWFDLEGDSISLEHTQNELLLSRVLQACGLFDTLNVSRDEVYEQLYLEGKIPDLVGMTNAGFAEGTTACVPRHREIGFTIFSEGDAYWESQGIKATDPDVLQKMMQWVKSNIQYTSDDNYVDDTNYSSPNNLLYQWITYHILPMRIPSDKLVIHDNELGYKSSQPKNYTIPVYEYYTTMGRRRLLKIFESAESGGVRLNRFPILDNGRSSAYKGTPFDRFWGHELVDTMVTTNMQRPIVFTDYDVTKQGCLIRTDLANVNAMKNCIIYPIDRPLAYDKNTRENLGKERLRFDGMSLFPEAMTNNIRRNKQASSITRYRWVHIPNDRVYKYFENMSMNEETTFVYYNTYEDWCNLYEDEMKAVGHYEITVTLPPVPRQGTYELRYDVLANGNRGVVQPYFGYGSVYELPVTGIPMDLTKSANNGTDAEQMGWKDDGADDDDNAEIDHQMRLNGFMKGSNSVSDRNNGSERMAGHRENSRRILTTLNMHPDSVYHLKLKSVLDTEKAEFYMDYLELCPKEVYDNPETPEDIW